MSVGVMDGVTVDVGVKVGVTDGVTVELGVTVRVAVKVGAGRLGVTEGVDARG